MEPEVPLELAGSTHSATLELLDACKVLPNFDMFQIMRFPFAPPPPRGVSVGDGGEMGASLPGNKRLDV